MWSNLHEYMACLFLKNQRGESKKHYYLSSDLFQQNMEHLHRWWNSVHVERLSRQGCIHELVNHSQQLFDIMHPEATSTV